jgi:hypothetical protein
MDSTAVAVFETRVRAQDAIDALRRAGFAKERIGVVTRDRRREELGAAEDPSHSRWEEGTGVGLAAGAAAGTGLGLAVAAGLIPGIGPAIAGGTMMALLASAGAGAAVGGVLGGLVGLGIPEEEARYYEEEFQAGRTIVTVQADDRYREALEILHNQGGYNRRAGVGERSGVLAGRF